MENKRGFASRFGFIMSMAGFCIGVGNIWRFPYLVGNNGGGAFLLVYILLLLFAGIPMFLIEVTMGRSSQLSPILGMRKLEGKKKTKWSIIGYIEAIAIFIIVSYVLMIVGGWTCGYIVKLATGSLQGLDSAQISAAFDSHAGSYSCIFWSAVAAILMWFCLNSGIKKGVEKICSILLPILFVIMIGLAIYSNTIPGAKEGLLWYITPDLSKITFGTISAAITQVFFSLGVGMCCSFVYGSYNSKNVDLGQSIVISALMDTSVALLSGLVYIPALFAFGIEPTTGPSLLFITLPELFNNMGTLGNIFGILFLVCVFFAGFTSIIGGSESLIATITDGSNWSRKKACTVVTIAEFIFCLIFIFSFRNGFLGSIKILGMGLFDFADFISSGIGLTISAVLMLAYVIFRWKFEKFMEEANEGSSSRLRVYRWMKPYFYYVLPLVLLLACYCIIRTYIG